MLASWIVASVNHICPKCLAATNGNDLLAEASRKRLWRVHEVHIQLETKPTAVKMCCTKMWDIQSLFRNDIGFITAKQLSSYLKDKELLNTKLCKECLEHPMAQMTFLAEIDL